jgi:hypothetical protein
VDAGCFQSEERNVNPDYINVPGARDLDFEIRACFPRANKTTTFIVILSSGEILKLDPPGNTQAAKLVNAAGKPPKRQRHFAVNITGIISNDTIHVDSIASAK